VEVGDSWVPLSTFVRSRPVRQRGCTVKRRDLELEANDVPHLQRYPASAKNDDLQYGTVYTVVDSPHSLGSRRPPSNFVDDERHLKLEKRISVIK
jgi:hypothetical protein